MYLYRDIQLSNVAERATAERAVTFDKGVVIIIIERNRVVCGCPTAWFPTYIP